MFRAKLLIATTFERCIEIGGSFRRTTQIFEAGTIGDVIGSKPVFQVPDARFLFFRIRHQGYEWNAVVTESGAMKI